MAKTATAPAAKTATKVSPATKGAAEKPARPARPALVAHPRVGSSDKRVYPFTMTRDEIVVDGKTFAAQTGNFPKDYATNVHERLTGSDFATKSDYLVFRLNHAQKLAAKIEEALLSSLAGKSVGGERKKYLKMLEKAQAIRAKLLEQGMSEEELAELEGGEAE